MSSENNSYKGHISVITFLRAIAAMGVCVVHLHYLCDFSKKPFVDKLFNLGMQGVPIFFVISGFIIPYSLWNSDYSSSKFFKFIGRRALRIDPPYLVIIAIALATSIFQGLRIDIGQLLLHLFYLVPFTEKEWYSSVFWTLGIEFQFYIIMGLTFFLIKHTNIFILAAILLVISLYGYFIPFPNYEDFIVHHIHCFCIGILVLLKFKNRAPLVLVHSLLALIAVYFCWRVSLITGLVPYLTAITILHINLRFIITDFLGKISYSLYLTHFLSAGLLWEILSPFSIDPLALLSILILFSIGCAYLFFILIEKPSITLSKKFG